MPDQNPKTLGAILYRDFELLDLYGPLEMFGAIPGQYNIVTVANEVGPIASSAGPQTVAEYDFDNCPSLDLILLPGGYGTMAALADESLLDFLRQRSGEALYTMSVCSGSAILARSGVLDGRRATSNKQLFKVATDQSDQVTWETQARWVEDGPYVTASGVSAGTDMALAVLARLQGEEYARMVADMTEYQWHRDAGADPFSQFLNAMDVEAFVSAFQQVQGK